MAKVHDNIVVIRLGALGDLVLCFQAFQRIRAAHPHAHITLVTMPGFESFARSMPWFDDVITDRRAPLRDVGAWWRLCAAIRRLKPLRVYDLQGKFRQSLLFMLLGGFMGARLARMEWSGAAPLCSHPRLWPPVAGMHFTDFIAAQLDRAGLPPLHDALDLSWFDAPLDAFNLPERYALLIPGCAAGREYKRWSSAGYAVIADHLHERGITCLAIGTKTEADVIANICSLSPHVVDLSGRTSLAQLAALARHAVIALGNDTGPTHVVAAAGAPTLVLFAGVVNPVWSSPRGQNVRWIQREDLDDLDAAEVQKNLTIMISSA